MFLKPLCVAGFLGIFTLVAHGQDDTVHGALLDSPALAVKTNAGVVRLFDGARNDVLKAQGKLWWREMSYFYDAPLRVTNLKKFSAPNGDLVQFLLEVRPIEKSILVEALRGRNVDVREDRINPLYVFEVEVVIPGYRPFALKTDNGISLDEPVAVDIEAGSFGDQLITQLKEGQALNVRLKTLTKLTALQAFRSTWRDIRRTTAYQRFLGPAGPTFVTADQALDVTRSIASELRVFEWREGSSAVSASIATLQNKLFDMANRHEVALAEATDPKNLLVDLSTLQQKDDVLKRIASDAKNLTDAEWCRKYDADNSSSQKSSGEGGGEVDILGIFSAGGGGSSSTESSQTRTVGKSDCGKNKVENSFKYEEDGQRVIPKSIYVFSKNAAATNAADTAEVLSYSVGQRYGFISKTVTAR